MWVRVALHCLFISLWPASPSASEMARASNKAAILAGREADSLCALETYIEGYWTPSRAEVATMEAKMEDYVRANPPTPRDDPKAPSVHKSLSGYTPAQSRRAAVSSVCTASTGPSARSFLSGESKGS